MLRSLEIKRERLRRQARTDFAVFARAALSKQGQAPARHHLLLIRHLEDVAAGRCDRLMVLMPPGSAKSTYASVLYPPWWFARHPRSSVIAASHSTGFAERFGRHARDTIAEHADLLGYGLSAASASAARWDTAEGGEYFAAGVGAAITGRRADLVLIDDPFAGRAEADSETIREATWQWYRGNLYTRLKPGGRIVLIQTRWHQDDLGGRLLQEMANGTGDKWRVLKLPAIATDDDDPLGRAIGEPLWPEWESADELDRKRAAVGEREWSALYQQDPRPQAGALFMVGQLATLDEMPALTGRTVRAWDLAATAQVGTRDPDWTVGVKLARAADGRFVVLDVVRLRAGPHGVEGAILDTAEADGRGVEIGLPQDPGQAGKAQAQYLVSRLAGYPVKVSPESGDKATRAGPVAAQCNVGMLAMMRAAWNLAFREELAAFPAGSKDDQVDALSRAFGMLVTTATVQQRRMGY